MAGKTWRHHTQFETEMSTASPKFRPDALSHSTCNDPRRATPPEKNTGPRWSLVPKMNPNARWQ